MFVDVLDYFSDFTGHIVIIDTLSEFLLIEVRASGYWDSHCDD
jgi:hypothetical protein